MGFLKTTGKLLWGTARLTGKATVVVAKVSGKAVYAVAETVSTHREEISGAAKTVVKAGGTAIKGTGALVATGAGALGRGMHGVGERSHGLTGTVLGHATGALADTVGLLGKATRGAGSVLEDVSPAVGGAAVGVVSGALATVSGTLDTVALTDAEFEPLYDRLRKANASIKEQTAARIAAIRTAQRNRRKKELLDLLVVGGVSAAELLRNPGAIPADIERAFELAYPGLAASGETFASAVERIPAEDLLGLVNGVKGKLFEITLIEHLNAGNLPDGLTAELAASATQPGFDIRIVDAQDHLVEALQAKATESVSYVREALERYPDIDITTTSEVYDRLVSMGMAGVADSGISEAALQAKVEAAANGVDGSDLIPSSVGLAVIALSSFMGGAGSLEARGTEFGDRAAKAGLASAAAKTAMVASTWWLGLAVGVGARGLAAYGGAKRERYEALKELVEATERRARALESRQGGGMLPCPL